MRWIFYLSFFLFCFSVNAQEQQSALSTEEQKLYALITDYRKTKGLPEIPISNSLNYVAQAHAKDLAINTPVKRKCNAHSWSNKGHWTECCYTSNHNNGHCMWSKPGELTDYNHYGYEIVVRYITRDPSKKMTAKEALNSWKKSSGHNLVIVNKGKWKSATWQAIGIGIYNGAACVWFGEEKDLN